jgi:hypothetical protein
MPALRGEQFYQLQGEAAKTQQKSDSFCVQQPRQLRIVEPGRIVE